MDEECGQRMWTTRFTYFDSKCMHLSKFLHNPWSTLFVMIYLLLERTDNRKTVYIYTHTHTHRERELRSLSSISVIFNPKASNSMADLLAKRASDLESDLMEWSV